MTRAGLCVGCGACATASGSMAMDRYGQFNPGRSPDQRRRDVSGLCPFSPKARDEDAIAAERFPGAPFSDPWIGRFEAAFVGHAEEGDYRAMASSGGLASWLAAELMRLGLVDGVVQVGPRTRQGEDDLLFDYRISTSPDEVRANAKSRYYPVELSGVLEAVRQRPGRYALVGVPCFIKAAHLLRAGDPLLAERIVFTLGLFCGHSKSARMADSFAWQMGAEPGAVAAIDFRHKDPSRPANWYAAELRLQDGETRRQDWWHLADGDWGAGFFQNAACDYCDDITAETADVSFGDAWLEPYSSDGRGTNVVVARSALLREVLAAGAAEGRIRLEEVDADFVQRTQAAGFRHRREGLAFRLARRRSGLTPVKRTWPVERPTPRRRAVYWSRQAIARWSHRVFWLARRTGQPKIYLAWARLALRGYQALTWSHGRLGAVFDRLEKRFGAG